MSQPAALRHLAQVDPTLATALTGLKLRSLEPITDHRTYFSRLCEDIISQQLAVKAADAIIERFRALAPRNSHQPEVVLSLPDQTLRDLGLSWAKVKYVKDLASKTRDQVIHFTRFHALSDEEVIDELIQVKGIGQWTAEMFLIFTLGREDVFSFGDLGLRRGFQQLYRVSDAQLEKKMATITSRWAPYRSYGSLALWGHRDQS